MKYLRLLLILLLLLGFASIGSAAISVNDPWSPYGPSTEMNLYQIYEAMLSLSPIYSHTSDLNAFQIAPGVSWSSHNGEILQTYRFANGTQELMRYDGTYHSLISGIPQGQHTYNQSITDSSSFAWVDRAAGSLNWSSNSSLNTTPDGFYHFIAFSTGITGEYVFAFEDRSFNASPPSDGDYNDLVVLVSGVTPNFRAPEPTTLLLFGAGLVGVGLMRRRFKN